MSPTLRPYQKDLIQSVYQSWNQGAKNVLMRLDTGGGKTVTLSSIIRAHQGASCVMAHRQELVSQLSIALARNGIYHNIIGAQDVIKSIIREHIDVLGRSYYNSGAKCAVASVDTLVRADGLDAWFGQVTLWVVDEVHHLLKANKWGKTLARFTHPDLRGLGPTATPCRADGQGLGRHAEGLMDIMVQGPPMRWLIEQGYLSDYKIICPPSDMAMIEDVGASGDWSPKQLREASQRSHIVGDVVATYLKFAAGKLGITFSTDVETAEDITRAYRAAGVRAETLTGKTDSGYRRQMLKQYARREIDQIVAVDIVSEGFDLPAIEVASLARPTASLSLYMQQFGRALRILEGKSHALIIDHVGNTVRHNGTPDKPREWTLDRRDKKSKASAGVPIRVCLDCFEPFERILIKCPNCGSPIPEPAVRSSPAQVDGDLVLLDDAALAILRGQVAEADKSVEEYAAELAAKHVPTIGILANRKRHAARVEAQKNLREAMALWGGKQHNKGLSDREIQKAFYLTWGIDVLSAMALGTEESIALERRISDKKP